MERTLSINSRWLYSPERALTFSVLRSWSTPRRESFRAQWALLPSEVDIRRELEAVERGLDQGYCSTDCLPSVFV